MLLAPLILFTACSSKNLPTQETSTVTASDTIELIFPANAQDDVQHSIIWLHGLGATSGDFPPVVPHLGLDETRPIRFIFPQAPDRPVTVNGGIIMPAWYDIKSMDIAGKEDRRGMEESMHQVEALIELEMTRGISSENIILAGFSQGGAVTYYTGMRTQHKLAGLMALSSYATFQTVSENEQSGANVQIPVFAAHGENDPVVPLALGKQSVEHLRSLGYQIEWQSYPMQHEVSLPEIQAIGQWINRVFSQ